MIRKDGWGPSARSIIARWQEDSKGAGTPVPSRGRENFQQKIICDRISSRLRNVSAALQHCGVYWTKFECILSRILMRTESHARSAWWLETASYAPIAWEC